MALNVGPAIWCPPEQVHDVDSQYIEGIMGMDIYAIGYLDERDRATLWKGIALAPHTEARQGLGEWCQPAICASYYCWIYI
jgi:hypothetical protein